MLALSTVQTPVCAIAHFLRVPTPKHLLHEAIIVTRSIARVDVLEPVPVLGKDLFEDAPGRRGFCHHQAASLRGVGRYVVALFYHALPTNSTPSSARTGRWSPTCLALTPRGVRAATKCKFLYDQETGQHRVDGPGPDGQDALVARWR